MKRYIYIIIYTFVFTFFIFYIKNVFFVQENKVNIEKKYIEQSLKVIRIPINVSDSENKKSKLNYEKLKKWIIKNRKKEELESASKVHFTYIPDYYNSEIKDYTKIVLDIVKSRIFNSKILSLWVDMYREKIDVRGKMKDWNVKFFWVKNINSSEFIGLFIHEFSHYIDLYYFNKTIISDKSDRFYNISWNDTKILKKWQKSRDFVSGYAMTNKYEDFAESLTYYILHNKDFAYKAWKSDSLNNKYKFFWNILFQWNTFTDTNFSKNNNILDYYRDITKIDIKEQNFLQYIKN